METFIYMQVPYLSIIILCGVAEMNASRIVIEPVIAKKYMFLHPRSQGPKVALLYKDCAIICNFCFMVI